MNDYWKKWFGWSWSRHNMWSRCPLQYYYNYIGKWEPGLIGTKTKSLSKLTNLKMAKGGIAHDAIKRHIYHHSLGRNPNKDSAISFFERTIDEFKGEKHRLVEVINGHDISDENIEHVKNEGKEELELFFNEIWPNYEKNKYIQHEEFETFFIGDIKIWVVVDFISKNDDFYIVTDWKTGAPEDIDNIEQMKVYSLWAHNKFGAEYPNILTEVVFLKKGSMPSNKSFSKDEIKNLIEMIESDCEKWIGVKSIDDFKANPDIRQCIYCNFLTICKQGQEIIRE